MTQLADFYSVAMDFLLERSSVRGSDLGLNLQDASTPFGDISKQCHDDLDEINEIIEMKFGNIWRSPENRTLKNDMIFSLKKVK